MAGVTNEQLVKLLGLPKSIITDLQTAQGSEYSALANEFLSALYNKVLYQTVEAMEFTNPFKKFDGFPINYGDTIENIFVEVPSGYKFNPDATDPFTKAKPTVKALYATINYELQYETTVEDALLRRACINEYGFMNLIDTILSRLSMAMSLDEYYATICMLNNKAIFANGFEDVTIATGATAEAKAKTITQTIVGAVSKFKLPLKNQNKLGVKTVTDPSNVLLVIKDTLYNDINLDYLAGVYNLSKVDLVKNIILVDSFQTEQKDDTTGAITTVGEDIDFMVIDTKGFDCHTALQDGGLIYNPKGKYTNHYYNLWKIVSFKYFYNARAFKIKTA